MMYEVCVEILYYPFYLHEYLMYLNPVYNEVFTFFAHVVYPFFAHVVLPVYNFIILPILSVVIGRHFGFLKEFFLFAFVFGSLLKILQYYVVWLWEEKESELLDEENEEEKVMD